VDAPGTAAGRGDPRADLDGVSAGRPGEEYPIGYGAVARLPPEWLYLATLRRWLARDSYFHYYCHTFEFGGIPRGTRLGNRRLAAMLSTRLCMLRCWKRQGLLEAILRSASFGPIEAALFRE